MQFEAKFLEGKRKICTASSSIRNNRRIMQVFLFNPQKVSLPWPTLKVSGVQMHPNVFSMYLNQSNHIIL